MPDWKTADDYLFTKNLDRRGWAWEFMRRNVEYRSDFDEIAKARKSLPRKGHLIQSSKSLDVDQLERQLAAKWGQMGRLADPSSNQVPPFLLEFPVQPDGEQVDAFYYAPDESGEFIQRREYATLTFDVRKQLAPQVRRARQMLLRRQKHVKVTKAPHKGVALWPLYLRLLDAYEASAKTAEIIENIKTYKILGNTAATGYAADDRVSDHRAMAKKLRADPLSLIR